MGTRHAFRVIAISTLVLMPLVVLLFSYTRPRTEPQKIINKNGQNQPRNTNNSGKYTSAEKIVSYNNPAVGLFFSYPIEWGEVILPGYTNTGTFSNNLKITISYLPIEYAYETKAVRDIDSPSCLLVLNKPLLFKEERAALSSIKKTCVSTYSLIPAGNPQHMQCEITSIGDPPKKTILRWYEIDPTCGEGAIVEGPIRELKSYTMYSPTQRVEFSYELDWFSYGKWDGYNNFDFLPYITKQENVVSKTLLNNIKSFDEMVKTLRITK